MPVADAWDWPFLYYTATVLLQMPEKSFWRSTPKKLAALAEVHVRLNGGEKSDTNKRPRGYIDQVM
ncbi:hypothetical protein D3C81_323970 [compost metagenome]